MVRHLPMRMGGTSKCFNDREKDSMSRKTLCRPVSLIEGINNERHRTEGERRSLDGQGIGASQCRQNARQNIAISESPETTGIDEAL